MYYRADRHRTPAPNHKGMHRYNLNFCEVASYGPALAPCLKRDLIKAGLN